MREYSRQEIKGKVLEAKRLLLLNDQFLLEYDLNERTISHKFADYLQRQFPDWHVDCEYNRVHDSRDSHCFHDLEEKLIKKKLSTKKLITGKGIIPDTQNNVVWTDTDARTVYPDIIVHHRNTDENLLVIEMKKSSRSNGDVSLDKDKLNAFIGEPFRYQHGLFIQLPTGRNHLSDWHFEWFPEEPTQLSESLQMSKLCVNSEPKF